MRLSGHLLHRPAASQANALQKQELDVLSSASNAAVVRAPGRRYPGVVVQGDTLANLAGLAAEAASECESESGSELSGLLDGLLRHYERVMAENGLELPYHRAV